MDYYEAPKTEIVYQIDEKRILVKNSEDVKKEVRKAYGGVAKASSAGKSCGNGSSCCGVSAKSDSSYSQSLGYSSEELAAAPEGANMGLGCGNPQAIAALKSGETVLDLGSGGGFDAFLAADKVGKSGKVYGVDMTHEMLQTARENAQKGGFDNVQFLLGEIEHLPLPNDTVDVIISNCVINLSTDKESVFRESFRVLKAGGRLAISDVVANRPLPEEMTQNEELYCNCISGAITKGELEEILSKAGFTNIAVEPVEGSSTFIEQWVPGSDAEDFVVSARITAEKPVVRG